MNLLFTWLGLGVAIAVGLRRHASWPRALGVGLAWPAYPALAGRSYLRYRARRRRLR